MFEYMNGPGEDQNERMFFRAVEIFAALSFLMWFAKKIFRHPAEFVLFLVFGVIAVWTCYLIPHGNWLFYPVAFASVCFLIRTAR
jgi:hypothetical protein